MEQISLEKAAGEADLEVIWEADRASLPLEADRTEVIKIRAIDLNRLQEMVLMTDRGKTLKADLSFHLQKEDLVRVEAGLFL